MNNAAMRKSLDPMEVFKSPLGNGRIDRGYENLEVICLQAPDEKRLDLVGTLAAAGHAGAFGQVLEFIQEGKIEEVAALNIGQVGLQQILEMENVCFLIYGCTRAFTHEMVRTRKGAWYLQQTMRHTDMGNANMRMPESIVHTDVFTRDEWVASVEASRGNYEDLIEQDIPYEDARTVLPLATETWIIAGMPLRTWLETYAYRSCEMFYPEMQYVFRRMKEELAKKSPKIAEQAKISCEVKGVCTYRGAEDTTGCSIYPGSREWQSPLYDDKMLLALYEKTTAEVKP